jgi:predicted nucleic acid-binding protein
MSRNASPAQVRTWVEHPPDWLEIRSDPAPDPTLNFLDFGERAAISLAELVGADKLLIDEWAGRTEAERRHLSVTGTLGVVADAHIHGLLDFDTALSRLRATNFRLAAEVERFVRLKLSTRIAKSIRDGEDAQ